MIEKRVVSNGHLLQGNLAHKKTAPPPRINMGPWVKSHCRVLGGGC
jgi:hypothetical protein